EAQIRMNADKVPMLTSLASSVRGMKPAVIAVATPRIMVGRYGVPYLGWLLANQCGSRPSRDSANQMREAPSMNANTTLAMPHTAATLITKPIQCRPRASKAALTGAGMLSSVYGTMPVSTSDTPKYMTMANTSDNTTATGRSRCGFLDSSAAVVSVS